MVTLELLANSIDSIHEDSTDAKPFECPVPSCQREFSSKRNLVDHVRGHHQGAKPHICPEPGCGKSFLRPAHLIIHTRIHTGEKPFVCEFPGCGKRWNQKSALKQHLRSHTGEKPFACSSHGCNKVFSTSSSCKRHTLTHQKPEIECSKKRKAFEELPLEKEEDPSQLLKKLKTFKVEATVPAKSVLLQWGENYQNLPLEQKLNLKMTLNFILNSN